MPKAKNTRAHSAARRAAGLAIYATLGENRSIRAVYETAQRLIEFNPDLTELLGVEVKAWERYSREDGWVERAVNWDAEVGQRNVMAMLEDAFQSDAEQAAMGRMMQRIGMAHLKSKYDEENDRPADDTEMSDTGSIRAVEVGNKITRLAQGQATERREMVIGFWNRIIVEFPGVLEEALAALPEGRLSDDEVIRIQRRVAQGLDNIFDRFAALAAIDITGEG